MPVRWTADNDHLVCCLYHSLCFPSWTKNDAQLLITLLKTHNINVEGDLIRNAWRKFSINLFHLLPLNCSDLSIAKDGRKIPSASAITERIVKIRFLAKEAAKKVRSKSANSTQLP